MNEVQELEISIETAKAKIALGRKLEELTNNRHFRELVLKGYLEDEAIRLVHLKAEPSMESEEAQKQILIGIDGIGSLKGFFRKIQIEAQMAERALVADEKELEFALKEIAEGEGEDE